MTNDIESARAFVRPLNDEEGAPLVLVDDHGRCLGGQTDLLIKSKVGHLSTITVTFFYDENAGHNHMVAPWQDRSD